MNLKNQNLPKRVTTHTITTNASSTPKIGISRICKPTKLPALTNGCLALTHCFCSLSSMYTRILDMSDGSHPVSKVVSTRVYHVQEVIFVVRNNPTFALNPNHINYSTSRSDLDVQCRIPNIWVWLHKWMANTTPTNIYQNLWSCGHVILTHTHIEPIYVHYVSLFCCILLLKIPIYLLVRITILVATKSVLPVTPLVFSGEFTGHFYIWCGKRMVSAFDVPFNQSTSPAVSRSSMVQRRDADAHIFLGVQDHLLSHLSGALPLVTTWWCWTLEMFEEVWFGYNHSTIITTNHTKEVCVFISLYSCLDICYYYNSTPWNISLPIYKYVYLYL